MRRMIVLLLALVVLSGCTQWQRLTPTEQQAVGRLRLAQAVETYNTVLKAITVLRKAGKISDAQAAKIETYRQLASDGLEAWRAATEDSLDPADAVGQFQAALNFLIAQRMAAMEDDE